MSKFSVGKPVKTTVEWNSWYWAPEGVTGTVEKIRDRGPLNPDNTVFVRFGRRYNHFRGAWFNPKFLELDESGS